MLSGHILCACGCGKTLEEHDKHGRKRRHIYGHQLGGRMRVAGRHFNWKGGEWVDTAGYIQTYAPDHPNAIDNHVRRSRLVMEKHIGRYLKPSELVLHTNGNNQDDTIENLTVMTRREFTRKMHLKDMSDRVCAICSSSVTTHQHKSDRPMWYRYGDGISFICTYCYQRRRISTSHKRYRDYEHRMLENNLKATGTPL